MLQSYSHQISVTQSQIYCRTVVQSSVSPLPQIVLQPDPDNTNLTITMELPVTALPSGYCKNPQTNKTDDNTQQISLNWADTDKKTGVQLNRSITIDFLMNVTSLKYGASA